MSADGAPTALVVGASSEIGTAVAAALAGLGHRLDLWGRDAGRLERAADVAGPDAAVHRVDVTDRDAVEAAVATLRRPLRVAVCAVGAFDWADALDADPAAWDEVLTTSLTATVRVSRLVLPLLVEAAPSTLVLVGSMAGVQAFGHNAAHVTAKHGLTGFARALLLDVRDRGVRVTLVNPGMVAAGPSLGSPRGWERPESLLAPEDVAAAVTYAVTAPPRACVSQIDLQPLAGD